MAAAKSDTVVYSTRDNIDHLRIRVRLRKLGGFDLINATPRPPEEAMGGNEDVEELILGWRQRILSPSERLVQQEQHRQESEERRIFTVTPDVDTTEMDDEPESFFIMADMCSHDGPGGFESPALLCRLTYHRRGQLTASPGFGGPPRRLEGAGGAVFDYTLETVSQARPSLRGRHAECLQAARRPLLEWQGPSVPCVQLGVQVQLQRLHCCETGARVYLSYALHLPSGWRGEGDTQEGTSHECLVGADGAATLGVPVTWTLSAPDADREWPSLLLAAVAMHSGRRERDLGYAAVDLSPYATTEGRSKHVALWLPAPTTHTEALRQLSLPHCRSLPHTEYLAPKRQGGLSRFGLVTVTPATVEYSVDTLLSGGAPVLRPSLAAYPQQMLLEAFRRSRGRLRQATAAANDVLAGTKT